MGSGFRAGEHYGTEKVTLSQAEIAEMRMKYAWSAYDIATSFAAKRLLSHILLILSPHSTS